MSNDLASYYYWRDLVKKVGVEEAQIVTRFQNKHLDMLLGLVEMYHLDCDMMERETVDAYFDHERFEQAKQDVREVSRHVEELEHKIYKNNFVYPRTASVRSSLALHRFGRINSSRKSSKS
jgi:hypothetical protein